MEPKKQINPNDLIIFINIHNEDHEWQFDSVFTPIPYRILAGQTREMPYYIARHGIDKLIDTILMLGHQNPTNQLLRDQLLEKIILGKKAINQQREMSAQEQAAEEMSRKKDTDPYEELFTRRRIESEREAEHEAHMQLPPAPLYKLEGTPIKPALLPDPESASPIVDDAAAEELMDKINPDRQRVYQVLTNKAHLDLTHEKTKAALDAMPLEQIVNEYKVEYPELVDATRVLVPDTKESLSGAGMPDTPSQPLSPEAPTAPSPIDVPAAPLLAAQLG